MNEIEQRIRELTLREPDDTLDQRVLSSLHGSTAATNLLPVNSPPKNESIRMRRGILSGAVSGLVAALLIGIAIGNVLPSIWSRFGGSSANRSAAFPEDKTVLSAPNVDSGDSAGDEEFPDRHPMTPELSQHLRDALQNRPTVGSQFVESVYLSAIAGASRWERQNGEKFNVSTHVSDRRFDMCRDCHRVGG